MRRLTLLAALLALVATACKIEANFEAIINANGSGTVVTEIGVDDEAKQLLFSDGTDPLEGTDIEGCTDARTREESRDDMTFYIAECDVADITSIEDAMTEGEDSMVNTFDITITDTLVTVSGSASAEGSLGEETAGMDPTQLLDFFSANLRITMPGQILEHNADARDGNTLTWEIPITGGALDVQATSDPRGTPSSAGGGGGFPVWLIAVIAVVVLGGAWYLWSQNRKGGSSSSDAPPPAPAA